MKKVATDEHTTTFEHPTGHKIVIAHSKIKDPKLKKQLEDIPIHMADGGFPSSFSDPLNEGWMGKFDSEGNMLPQSQVVPPTMPDIVPSAPAMELQGRTPPIPSPPVTGAGPQPLEREAQPQQQAGPSNYQIPMQQPSTSSALTQQSMGQMMDLYTKGLKQQQAGIWQQAKAEGDYARLAQIEAQSQQQQLKDMNTRYQENLGALNQERQALMDDVKNSKIDPMRYLNSRSTGKVIANSIGLILGGIGGGMTHQENPALKFLNAQIDRDIEAQKLELNKKENLLTANYRQYGNLNDAEKMTRAFYQDLYATKLQEAAAKTTDPMAKARAMQAAGQIQAQTDQIYGNMAYRQALIQGAQQGQVSPLDAINAFLPQHEQKMALDELKEQENLNHLNEYALDAFDKLAAIRHNPIEVWKWKDAYWNPMIEKVAKENVGRAVPLTVDLMDPLSPAGGKNYILSDADIAEKRRKFAEMLNGNRSTPVLDGLKKYGINIFKNQGQFTPMSGMKK